MSTVTDIFNAMVKLPQTQQDIRTIAQTGEQFQSPGMQQQIEAVRSDVMTYAGVQLTLQLLSTASIVLMAILAWSKHKG